MKANPKADLRLVCFPYAGGGSSIFRSWPNLLPPNVEVLALQMPGRETRIKEPPIHDFNVIVREVASAILSHVRYPVVFFGHSMGALISFEVAHHLVALGQAAPKALFVSGSRAPHMREPMEAVSSLPDQAFINEIKKLDGTPEDILNNIELMELLLPVLRADFAVCESYQYNPKPALCMPIYAFGGIDDVDIRQEHIEGWHKLTTASCSVDIVPGGHFYIHSSAEKLLAIMADKLVGCISGK